jgi:hypothetical protein
MSTTTPKEVNLSKQTKILITAQGIADADNMDSKDYDFLMDIDVPSGKTLSNTKCKAQGARSGYLY